MWLSASPDVSTCEECLAFEGASLAAGERERLGRELSRIVAEAYKAAGRPRQVTRVWTRRGGWGECLHRIRSGPRRYEYEPATEAEWRAWSAWVVERDRLREQLAVNRGRHNQRHKLVGWEGPATHRWEADPKPMIEPSEALEPIDQDLRST